VGTNLGLLHLLLALLSGRFLQSRGAMFAALADLGLPAEAMRRAGAALCYGRFGSADLRASWQRVVGAEGVWCAHAYEGLRPVACDLVGFFRPRVQGCASKHFKSEAQRALPALVFALVGGIGSVGKQRLALPRLLLRQEPDETTEADLMRRALLKAGRDLAENEALVVDAGFALSDLLACGVPRFVARLAKNSTARRNRRPAYTGKGRPPEYGERVRPVPGKRKGQPIAATRPDTTVRWTVSGRAIRADVLLNLVLPDAKPETSSFHIVVIFDPPVV
jgi:hypothetical protein